MLRRLSGRDHRVVTAVRLRRGSDAGKGETVWSGVRFAPMTEKEIAWYVATGEPSDKAGAYAVQGLGARFVRKGIEDDADYVVLADPEGNEFCVCEVADLSG